MILCPLLLYLKILPNIYVQLFHASLFDFLRDQERSGVPIFLIPYHSVVCAARRKPSIFDNLGLVFQGNLGTVIAKQMYCDGLNSETTTYVIQ